MELIFTNESSKQAAINALFGSMSAEDVYELMSSLDKLPAEGTETLWNSVGGDCESCGKRTPYKGLAPGDDDVQRCPACISQI